MFSFVGDTVLDPFAGTGTTAIAALETGRNSISIDIDEDYVRLIGDRLMKHEASGVIDIAGSPHSQMRTVFERTAVALG
jgi:site-specific DNA-methyltransferase (adenine-specific)